MRFLIPLLLAVAAVPPDEQLLKDYQLSGDAVGLLQYFHALRSGEQTQALIQQLGSDKFDVRETATRRLTVLAVAATEELKRALEHRDAEVRRRAEEVLGKLETDSEPILRLMLQAVRRGPPAGIAPELLQVLPALKQEHLHQAAEETLWAVVRPDDAEKFREALKHDSAELRAAALVALEKVAGARAADDARAHLRDRDERVRLAAVRALAGHAARECLGPLVGLLEAERVAVRTHAVSLLHALTGEQFDFVPYDEPARRKEAVARWQTWLKDHAATTKLHPVPKDLAPPVSRVLLCLFSPYRIEELDLAGKVVFTSRALGAACGCLGLPGGRRVFSDWEQREVVELDAQGKVVWKKPVPGTPNTLDRLANGNLLVGLFSEKEVVEMRTDGTILWRAAVEGQPTDARRLPNGRTLVALFETDRVVELNGAGKVVWTAADVPSPESARRLASGTTLVASSRTGQVLEYSPAGKLVWSARDLPSAYDAVELENGNILVGYERGLREITRRGEKVREWGIGMVRRIARY